MRSRKILIGALTAMALATTSCSTYSLVNSEVYNNADLANYHSFRIISPDEDSLPPGMELVTYYNIAAAVREQLIERGWREDPNSPIIVNLGLTVNKELQTTPIGALMPPPSPPIMGPAPIPAPAPPAPAPGPGSPAPGPGAPGGGTPPPPGGPGGGPMPSEASSMQAPPPPAPAPAPTHFFGFPGPGPAPAFAPYFMMPRSYYWGSVNPATPVVTGIYKEGVLTMDIVDMSTKTALYSASVAAIIDNGDSQFRNLQGIAQAVQVLFSKFPVPVLPQYRK